MDKPRHPNVIRTWVMDKRRHTVPPVTHPAPRMPGTPPKRTPEKPKTP